MAPVLVHMAAVTADTAQEVRARADRPQRLTIGDLHSITESVVRVTLHFEYFLQSHVKLLTATYAYSYADIHPRTPESDLTGRVGEGTGPAMQAIKKLRRACGVLHATKYRIGAHVKALRDEHPSDVRPSAAGISLIRAVATLGDETAELARQAFGLKFSRLSLGQHHHIVGNVVTALEALQTVDGFAGSMIYLTRRAYDGTAMTARESEAVTEAFRDAGNMIADTAALLTDLQRTLADTQRKIDAAAAALTEESR